jgi:prepilin-type N-terminal cleavage/methylation domain-containing protein
VVGRRSRSLQKAFTLIELVIVLLLIGLLLGLIGFRTGTFSFWKEEGFIRQLTETVTFLHHQAVTDQAFYRLEFDFDHNTYRIGVMKSDFESDDSLKDLAVEAGTLSIELAAMLNPSLGEDQTMIPPPSFPSLAEPVQLPSGTVYKDVRTMRGMKSASEGGTAYMLFSPRGFSEFSVIHLTLSNGAPVTILVNPFTGGTDIYREYKDFKWTYGRNKAR